MSRGDAPGNAFDDADVVRAYQYRPAYPGALFPFVASRARNRRRALDLGCGPGKIAHQLADRFDRVDAVDPSLPMLEIADDGRHDNIRWIAATAESAEFDPPYDLVTAGASIHWMDHAVLFPRLASALDDEGVVAIIEGDDAHQPAWNSEWERFLERWLHRLGSTYDPDGFQNRMTAYREWLEVADERTFSRTVIQLVDHFIECQHSRATWSRRNLGRVFSDEFDRELKAMLSPFARDSLISYEVRTTVIWGRPRRRARSVSMGC